MSDYLPTELWSKILLKLPIISVIHCTAVCKQWRSIITSSDFISAHLSLSPQNPLLLTASPPSTARIRARRRNTYHFCLHLDAEEAPLRLFQNLCFPFTSRRGNVTFTLLGSVHGLILLSDDRVGSMILWNPSIRKSVFLPNPIFNSGDQSVLGFGFDSATNSHKVVSLVYLQRTNTPPLAVEVYSLRDRSWRKLFISADDVDYLVLEGRRWTHCFIHGAVHWIGYRSKPGQDCLFESGILVFDVGTEEFKKMSLPEDELVGDKLPRNFVISVVAGLLAVFVSPDNWVDEPYTNIWVKTDYYAADSWTKIASLDMKNRQVGAWLDLRRCCRDLLKEMSGGGEAGPCRDIQVHSKDAFLKEYAYGFLFSYTESLVLLDEDGPFQEVCEAMEKTQLGTNTN